MAIMIILYSYFFINACYKNSIFRWCILAEMNTSRSYNTGIEYDLLLLNYYTVSYYGTMVVYYTLRKNNYTVRIYFQSAFMIYNWLWTWIIVICWKHYISHSDILCCDDVEVLCEIEIRAERGFKQL